MFSFGSGLALVVVGLLCWDCDQVRLVDGSWCWVVVGAGIGGLSGVRVFGWKGVGNLGIGKVDLIWTPGQRPADLPGEVPPSSHECVN